MDLISIIIPVYNAETTLQETLDSVFAQTYRNWEIVFFDDRCTDGTLEIINRAKQTYPEIRVIPNTGNENAGPAAGRNLAANHAKGEILAFLDSDDVWFPNYLEERMKVYAQFPEAGMVWGPSLRYYTRTTLPQDTGLVNQIRQYEKGSLVETFLLNTHGTPNPSATIMKKSNFLKVGGFDKDLKRGEDISMAVKVSLNFPVVYDYRLLFAYRKHEDSSTNRSRRDGTFHQYNQEFIKWSIAFAKENGLSEKVIDKLELSYYNYLARKYEDTGFIEGRKALMKDLREEKMLRKHWVDYLMTAVLPMRLSIRLNAKLRSLITRI